jgi:molecular chaperone GrpE (heat shock protein)
VKAYLPKVDDKFDPATMDAIDTIEGEKDNIVTKVYASGYKLHDHLIRPARVQVSVIKKEEKKPEEKLDA